MASLKSLFERLVAKADPATVLAFCVTLVAVVSVFAKQPGVVQSSLKQVQRRARGKPQTTSGSCIKSRPAEVDPASEFANGPLQSTQSRSSTCKSWQPLPGIRVRKPKNNALRTFAARMWRQQRHRGNNAEHVQQMLPCYLR